MEHTAVARLYNVSGSGVTGKTAYEIKQIIKELGASSVEWQQLKSNVTKTFESTGIVLETPPAEFLISPQSLKSDRLHAIFTKYNIEVLKDRAKIPRMGTKVEYSLDNHPQALLFILKHMIPEFDPYAIISGVAYEDDDYQIIVHAPWDLEDFDAFMSTKAQAENWEEVFSPVDRFGVGELSDEDKRLLQGFRVEVNFKAGIPDINDSGVGYYVPSYTPNYLSAGYDKAYLQELHDHILSDKHLVAYREDYLQSYSYFYNDLRKMALENYFGNGSPEGQIARLASIYKVFNSTRTTYNKDMGYMKYKEIMDEWFPLSPAIAPLHTYDMEAIDPRLRKINLKADNGIVWKNFLGGVKAKNQYTLMQDYMLSSLMLMDFGFDVDQAMSTYQFMHVTMMKNKEEVYTKEQFRTKTRNYWVYNHFGQMPAQNIFMNVHHFDANFLNTYDLNPDNPSRTLLGWSPWYSGMDNLLVKFISFAKRRFETIGATVTYLVFSDNMYCIQKIEQNYVYFSLDGVKMEACHDLEGVRYECRRTLDKIRETQEILPGWENYFLNLFPSISINAIGVLGSTQTNANAMSSGTMGTGYFNTSRMIQLAYELERIDAGPLDSFSDTTLSQKVIDVCTKVGVQLTIERRINDIDEAIEIPGALLPLDMLGYDAYVCPIGNKGVRLAPILNYERILKSFIFVKKLKNYKGQLKIKDEEMDILNLTRMEALYYLGGWLYTPLNFEIERRSKILLKRIHKNFSGQDMVKISPDSVSMLNQLVDVVGLDIFTPDFVESLMRKTSHLPTQYNVYRLMWGEAIAKQLIKIQSFIRPTSSLFLAPPEILMEIFETQWFKNKFPDFQLQEVDTTYNRPTFVRGFNQAFALDVDDFEMGGVEVVLTKPFTQLHKPFDYTPTEKELKQKKQSQSVITKEVSKSVSEFRKWVKQLLYLTHSTAKIAVKVSPPRQFRNKKFITNKLRALSFSLLFSSLASAFRIPRKLVEEMSTTLNSLFEPYILVTEKILDAPLLPFDIFDVMQHPYETLGFASELWSNPGDNVGAYSKPGVLDGEPDFNYYLSLGIPEEKVQELSEEPNALIGIEAIKKNTGVDLLQLTKSKIAQGKLFEDKGFKQKRIKREKKKTNKNSPLFEKL